MEVIFSVGGKSTIAFAERLVMLCVWFMLVVLLFASNKAKKCKGVFFFFLRFLVMISQVCRCHELFLTFSLTLWMKWAVYLLFVLEDFCLNCLFTCGMRYSTMNWRFAVSSIQVWTIPSLNNSLLATLHYIDRFTKHIIHSRMSVFTWVRCSEQIQHHKEHWIENKLCIANWY